MIQTNNKRIAIVFDLDDTLIRTSEYSEYFVGQFFEFLEREGKVDKNFENFREEYFKSYSNSQHIIEVIRKIIKSKYEERIIEDKTSFVYREIFLADMQKNLDLFEDIHYILNQLNKYKIPIYLVSQGFEDVQDLKIRSKNLHKYFPDNRIHITQNKSKYFYKQIKLLIEVTNHCDNIINVGDSEEKDIINAKDADLITVRVKQGNKGNFNFEKSRATFKINEVREIIEVIKNIQNQLNNK